MPSIDFLAPAWFALLPFTLLPFWRPGQKRFAYPATACLPEDRRSTHLDLFRRFSTFILLNAIVVGLAGPFITEQKIQRTGTGAHIVLTIDRSSSMNENFSGRYMGGAAKETKSAAARQLLLDFVSNRQEDLFAMVSFSTAPAHVLSLTQDRKAIKAAIRAIGLRGSGNTNIAPGLAMALEQFRNQPLTGARVILLVSDGAAQIDVDIQDRLRQDFQDLDVRLYWIYLRNPNGIGLLKPPKRNVSETTTPEYFLHQYFQTLGVPYRAFEAENPESLAQAIAEIDRLENQPLQYEELLPRRDLSNFGYGLALLLGIPLLALKAMEISSWP